MTKSKKVNKTDNTHKQSNAAKIRTLLAEGKSVDQIVKKLKLARPYVYQVKWHWQKDAKQTDIPTLIEQRRKKASKEVEEYNEEQASMKAAQEAVNKLLRWSVPAEMAADEDKAAQQIGWHVAKDTQKDSKDMVNSPDHYTAGGIETIDFIEAKGLGYNLGNAVKYISRSPYKGKFLEDLKKAVWYLQREIAIEEKNEETLDSLFGSRS